MRNPRLRFGLSVQGEGNKSKPRLLEQAREVLRLRHYSLRTEDSYLMWMKRYILFHHQRHPAEMGGPDMLYGSGLRLFEGCGLRVTDLDLGRGKWIAPRWFRCATNQDIVQEEVVP